MEFSIPKPLVKNSVCGGIATIFAWGVHHHPESKLYNWSLRKLQDEKFELARRMLLRYAKNSTIWAPPPVEHNGLVVCPKEISFDEIDIATEGIIIRRGKYADGVILHSILDAFLFSPADCATLILSYEDANGQKKVIGAHASRNSVINTSRFTTKTITREHEGIVESVLSHVPDSQVVNVKAWIGIGISAGPHFAHNTTDKENPWNSAFIYYVREKYGSECFMDDEKNGTLGWLDLKILVKKQLLLFGIPEENIEIDTVCTYLDRHPSGEHMWYSNVRNNEHEDNRREAYRNLVLVVRNY